MTRICAWRRRWSVLPALLDVPALLNRVLLVAGLVATAWLLGHATAAASDRLPETGSDPVSVRPATEVSASGIAGSGTARADTSDRVRTSIAATETSARQPDRDIGPDRLGTRDQPMAGPSSAGPSSAGPPSAGPSSWPGRHRTADAVAAELREHRERAQSRHPATAVGTDAHDHTATPATDDARGDSVSPPQRPDAATTPISAARRGPDQDPGNEPPASPDLRVELPVRSADASSPPPPPAAQREHELPRPRAPNPAPLPLPSQLPASAVLTMTGSVPGTNGLRGTLAIEPGAVALPAPAQVRPRSEERPAGDVTPAGPTVTPD